MNKVSEKQFLAAINPQNVRPRVNVASLKLRFHIWEWEMQDGTRKVSGMTVNDSHEEEPTEFYLSR